MTREVHHEESSPCDGFLGAVDYLGGLTFCGFVDPFWDNNWV